MNVYDSSRFFDMLFFYGYKKTEDIETADIIIVNTCTVRKKAEEKAFSFLGRVTNLKKKNPALITCITGCLAQQEGKNIFKRVPFLNIVLGTDCVHKLPAYIKKIENGEDAKIVDIEELSVIPTIKNFKIEKSKKPTAFITIMQGCDNFCSYCIVPFVRGREKSRTPENIIDEIEILSKKGIKEIVLLGQNVNSYGKKEGLCLFPELLHKVSKINAIERIRFATSHPKDMSDDLIEAFKNIEKLCFHIHLPVQSGSNNVLSKMNRKYTRETYLSKIEKIKKISQEIAITTDIIVGFPAESETDFKETVNLIKEVEFDNIFAFIYSDRKETKASFFKGKISKEAKKTRINKLLFEQKKITKKKNEKYIGKTEKVLCENLSKSNKHQKDLIQFTGRTGTNKIVNFFHTKNDIIGEILDIKITNAMPNSLFGEVIK